MIKIDHSAQVEAVSPQVPALAVLADQLLGREERQRARFSEGDDGLSRIKTGCLEIDNYVLCGGKNEPDGGFERGVVVGLSAADGNESLGGRLISLNLIASVLLKHVDLVNAIRNPQNKSRNTVKPKVMVIDTTGSFSLPLLVKVLRSRIFKMRHETRNRNDASENLDNFNNSDEIEIQKQVNAMLGLVGISRVFNIEGLWEVLSEMGRTDSWLNNNGGGQEISTNIPPKEVAYGERRAEPLHKLPDEIGDSEDEDIDLLTPPPVETASHISNEVETNPEILIIDNMHYLISHLFTHSEKTSAHNLLCLLSRTLHTLTHTQNILTILHNSTISTKINFTKHGTRQPPPPAIQSVFTSTAQKPSLGRIFDEFLDLHVMVSKVPKLREDAEVLYGQDENLQNEVSHCLVFEVLRDECPVLGKDRALGRRFGDREQRWGLFEIGIEGTSLVDAFQSEITRDVEGNKSE
ncbi:hypothetical protein EYC80_006714 [Monilinia laxa]|uniref:DNA recombination and repair protein Rad51-like C-terminal domain-containing protein n=1 Tax=Monilinia laxa TaxID=61186 RepID=A0A5N6JZE0_MONLA|nr:hypothetical protein EYC80_006714 [Monilinia laxa]